jgi:hypothetical protein
MCVCIYTRRRRKKRFLGFLAVVWGPGLLCIARGFGVLRVAQATAKTTPTSPNYSLYAIHTRAPFH